MRRFPIGTRWITDDTGAYVIAEIGSNHQGSVKTACDLIKLAATCGVDAVKFQKRDNATLYSRELLEAPYCNEQSFGPTYGKHRLALELTFQELVSCRAMAHACHVEFFATAFDEASADLLCHLDVPAIKTASGSVTDLALLRYLRGLGKPLIVSTGGAGWREVDQAVSTLSGGAAPFALLHCTASYPVREYADLHLRVIASMRDRYPDTVIGWSGHDDGIAMALVAWSLGARIIEKHFTNHRSNRGTDHAFSLEPGGMTRLCRDLVRAHEALGDGEKRYLPCEVGPIAKMRRRQTADGWKITGQRDEF